VGSSLLVIGYGNTLRRDDGVGPRVAETLEELNLPGVLAMACPQLTPELAEPLSQADAAVFVDAAVGHRRPVRLRRLDPSESAQILAHAADPRTLLALARDAFGRAPKAWMLTIPAKELGFGERLSRSALRGLGKAVSSVRALHRRLQRGHPPRPRAG
jgi:hydrogenase maturation protease